MNCFLTSLLKQFVNSSLFCESTRYLKNVLNNSGIKMTQQLTHTQRMMLILWLDFYLRLIETYWSARSMQEKSQSADFANLSKIAGKISNVIRWYEIAFVYMCPDCFHALRFHSNTTHNSSTGMV